MTAAPSWLRHHPRTMWAIAWGLTALGLLVGNVAGGLLLGVAAWSVAGAAMSSQTA